MCVAGATTTVKLGTYMARPMLRQCGGSRKAAQRTRALCWRSGWQGQHGPRGAPACVQVPIQEILANPFLPPLERLARLTPGYAGSDIRDVVHHGTPQDDNMDRITYESLLLGLSKVRSTLTSAATPGRCRSPGAQAMLFCEGLL